LFFLSFFIFPQPNIDVQMPDCFHKGHFVPIPALLPCEKRNSYSLEKDYPLYKSRRLKKPFTETVLLPHLKSRQPDEGVSIKRKTNREPRLGYRRHYKKFLDGMEGHWLNMLNDEEKQSSLVKSAKSRPQTAEVRSEKLFPAIHYNKRLTSNA